MNYRLLFACVFVVSALGCDASGDTDAGPVCADCGRDSGPRRDAGFDAGRESVDAGSVDAGSVDAGLVDAAAMDAAMPGDAAVPSSDAAVGAVCSLNRDCAASQRCECDEVTGCACATGSRGTGQNGVDSCTDGNGCESSLCVEGIDMFYCSDECMTDDDCGAALPRCLSVAFVGRICARTPPDAG